MPCVMCPFNIIEISAACDSHFNGIEYDNKENLYTEPN